MVERDVRPAIDDVVNDDERGSCLSEDGCSEMLPDSAVEEGDRLETREVQASEVEVDVRFLGCVGGGGGSVEGDVDWVEEGEEVEEVQRLVDGFFAGDLEGYGHDGGEGTRAGKSMAKSGGKRRVVVVVFVVLICESDGHGPDLSQIEIRLELRLTGRGVL